MSKVKRQFNGRDIRDEWKSSQDELPTYLDYDASCLGDDAACKIRPGLLPVLLYAAEFRIHWSCKSPPRELLDCIIELQKVLLLQTLTWPLMGWIVLHPDISALIMRNAGVDEHDIQRNVLKDESRIFSCGRIFGWDAYAYKNFPKDEILMGVNENEPYARISIKDIK